MSPILDERKWAKVPSIPADAFILDLEDAVPANGKERAREKVISILGNGAYFDGRLVVARPNPLDSPWGRDDILALSLAHASVIMIAKVDEVANINEVLALTSENGHMPSVIVSIESAIGVLNARDILAHPSVVAAIFGVGDLHVDAHMDLYEPDGTINPGFTYPKVHTILAAAAVDVPVFGFAHAPDIRDLAEIRVRMEFERRLGFSGLCAFYPPHVELVNDVFTPSPEQIAIARETVEHYERALADGYSGTQTRDGKAILIHQYKSAQRLLDRGRRTRFDSF